MRGLLVEQDNVIARRQALAAGLTSEDIRRLVRRREWAVVHPGVYVAHTGPLPWQQRAWAAVLNAGPGAALCHVSALRAAEGPGRVDRDESTIHVAIGRHRAIIAPRGVQMHRMSDLESRVLWNVGPPRLRYEAAVLDVALDQPTAFAALGVLAAACQSRRTTARRLAEAVAARSRVRHRAWLLAVLDDVAEGTCSVLEHGYLTRVERPHGLPRPVRQVRSGTTTGVVYRDADYGQLIIELDGRLFHDSAAQRDRDFERDLDAAVGGQDTRRLSWGQVFDRGCSTAGKVGALLMARGWQGRPHPCGSECALREL